MSENKAWFNSVCELVDQEQNAIMQERGGQYGDSWGECQWLALRATMRKVSGPIDSPEICRAMALAALVDIKYQRLMGGYKEDTPQDLCNYLKGYVVAMREAGNLNTPSKKSGLETAETASSNIVPFFE